MLTVNSYQALTNISECTAYCQRYPSQCPGFTKTASSAPSGEDTKEVFLGPSGCRTEGECLLYCQAHPDECQDYPQKSFSSFGSMDLQTGPAKSPSPSPKEEPGQEIKVTPPKYQSPTPKVSEK